MGTRRPRVAASPDGAVLWPKRTAQGTAVQSRTTILYLTGALL